MRSPISLKSLSQALSGDRYLVGYIPTISSGELSLWILLVYAGSQCLFSSLDSYHQCNRWVRLQLWGKQIRQVPDMSVSFRRAVGASETEPAKLHIDVDTIY